MCYWSKSVKQGHLSLGYNIAETIIMTATLCFIPEINIAIHFNHVVHFTYWTLCCHTSTYER